MARPAAGGTVALWLFDDHPGSTVARDSSGHGNDLTIGPGAAIVAGGKFGNALDADAGVAGGMGAYRDRVSAELNPGDSSWTLECWLKAKPDMTADNRIWGLSGVNYIDYGRGKTLQGLFVADRFMPAGGRWNWPTGDLAEQKWHHLAVVYDAKAHQIRHYFEGKRMFAEPCHWRAVEFDPKYEAVFPPQYPQLQIGMRDPIQQWDEHELHGKTGPRKRFGGYIDEMRFSDSAVYDQDFTPPGSFALSGEPSPRPSPGVPGEGGKAKSTFNENYTRAATSAEAVIDIGNQRQLFIDHKFIERSENVKLTVNPPQNVALDFAAAEDGPLYPSNIIWLKDRKVWRMYYVALARTSLRYVESTDGLHWKRPTDDNVVEYGDDHTPLYMADVMLDEHDRPERRFKAFQDNASKDPRKRGIHAYYSADGVHFTDAGRVLPIPSESIVTAYWDKRIGRYVVYLRVMNVKGGLKMLQGCQFIYRPDGRADPVGSNVQIKPGFENLRAIGRIETDDLLKPWPHNPKAPFTLYTTAQDIPMVLCADREDGFVDFYNSSVWIYPYAQDVYLAFPGAFRHLHPSREPDFHRFDDANGLIEVQFASSRDGVKWDRYDRAAYFPTGLTSQPDRWLDMMGVGVVRQGDWLYQYYWSTGWLHDSVLLRAGLDEPAHPSQLFAVKQRLDGFVSADVDYHGGWLLTPPVVFSGNRLLLNHNCNATGTIFVELRDLNGVPIPGYKLSECEEITGNDTGWEVRWRDKGSDVSSLVGKPIRIYFRMRNSKLYAFQFAP